MTYFDLMSRKELLQDLLYLDKKKERKGTEAPEDAQQRMEIMAALDHKSRKQRQQP